jgi:hypothetical protein
VISHFLFSTSSSEVSNEVKRTVALQFEIHDNIQGNEHIGSSFGKKSSSYWRIPSTGEVA